MPIWVVKATWIEDEVDASEKWQVNAPTAHDAVKEVTAYIRFPRHHVEAKLSVPDDEGPTVKLPLGQVRRIQP